VGWKYKVPRTKKCTKCGKLFETMDVSTKWCPDCHVDRVKKWKTNCDLCGRNILHNLKIPLNSTEKLYCSFCERDLRERRNKAKYDARLLRLFGKKCAVCGKLCRPVRYTKICSECYLKGLNPSFKEIEEVKE
jgi:hypothetical protein